ncbi:Uracil catabolism protein 4 [Venturia inaequalis]|nr:Uracil catabolism protein 4 [Venturia inaequalis]
MANMMSNWYHGEQPVHSNRNMQHFMVSDIMQNAICSSIPHPPPAYAQNPIYAIQGQAPPPSYHTEHSSIKGRTPGTMQTCED